MQSDSALISRPSALGNSILNQFCLNVYILSLYVCTMPIYTERCLISVSLAESSQTSDFTNSISIVLCLVHVILKCKVYFISICSAKCQPQLLISWGMTSLVHFLICSMALSMCSHKHVDFWQRDGTRLAIQHLKIAVKNFGLHDASSVTLSKIHFHYHLFLL